MRGQKSFPVSKFMKLPPNPPTKRKSIGQVKLVKGEILKRISSFASENDTVIEIGGGEGDLTALLSKKSKLVISFEIDERFKEEILRRIDFGVVVVRDFLSVPVRSIAELLLSERPEPFVFFKGDLNTIRDVVKQTPKFKIVANIPFYISSKLIHKLVTVDFPFLESVHILVQREFAKKIHAQPGSDEYSAISAIANFFFDIKINFDVPRFFFRPVPEVHSSFISLIPKRGLDESAVKNAQRFIEFAYVIMRKRKRLVGGKRAYQLSPQEIFDFSLQIKR